LTTALDDARHVSGISTDNGGQFMKDLPAILKERAIQQMHTHPRNPKQNGKIER
jgi:transposase InsO family protein